MDTKTTGLQTASGGSSKTAKQLYLGSQIKTLGTMLDIMTVQYRMELTAELAKFWKEALIVEKNLSPEQIKKGFMGYMSDPESTGFPPQPGDIVRNAPENATDKPRLRTDPDCKDCSGTGWKDAKVSGKTRTVTRCHCPRVIYDGKEYMPEQKQLPISAEDENKQSAEDIKRLRGKLPEVVAAAKAIPELPQLSDEELARRRERMLADLRAKGLAPMKAAE